MADEKINEQLSGSDEILNELSDVVATRVALTPEEQEIADRVTPHIKAIAKIEARKDLEVVLIKRQDEFNEKLRSETMRITNENFEQWKKENAPLDPNDLAKLLSQEYLEFEVPLKIGKDRKLRQFVITELVEAKENKLIKLIQKHLMPNLQKLSEIEWKSLESQADRIEALLGVIPDFLASMADAVAICLDPYEEDKEINAQWVMNNISSRRMISIIVAQAEANRYRDFLSDGFRLSKMFRTT